jgi:hypothetical protein
MPAAVLVVHNEPNTAALDAIEASSLVRVLVTRVMFGPGKLNGIALARMLRVKRTDTKVVFIAREEFAPHTEGLGVFLPMPLNPDILVATVGRLLVPRDEEGHELELPPDASERPASGRHLSATGAATAPTRCPRPPRP